MFSQQGNDLRIANSPGAIINWQGFSIEAGETTRFEQQSAASSVLNRVVGNEPSSIFGALSSNGQVFLINPSGIVFGQDASVDVAGLVASTLNLSDGDFQAGRLWFSNGARDSSVSSAGQITTPSGGRVYLVGGNVTNSGGISSPEGQVILAAGQDVSILDSGTPGVRVELGGDAGSVENLGAILANSGEVGIFGAALRNSGSVNADQVLRDKNGTIVFRATGDVVLTPQSRISADGEKTGTINLQSDNGTILADGEISARGTTPASRGGNIRLLGDRVGLLDVSIDASGASGGGTVLVGGDYMGLNPEVQNASRTYAGAGSTITADALTQGDGGRVILWADDFTRFLGNISARGGSESGNGGFVETSGKLNLEVLGGSVTTSAPHGQAGQWLLDPSNVNITNAASTGSIAGGIFTPNQDTAILNNLVLSTALQTGNVQVTTTNAGGTEAGTITVSAPVTRSAGAGTTTLTLTPNQVTGGTITIAGGGNISGSAASPLNVALEAAGVGATVAVGAPITTFGGSFSSRGTTFTNAGGAIDTSGTGTGGAITLNHTTTMTLTSPLTSGGGNISIAGGSTYTGTSTIAAGAGSITLRGSSDSLAIGIGSTTGTYNITQAQINGMTTTGGLNFGHSSGTGAITLGTNEAVNFGTKNVLVQQATGGITVTGSSVSGSGSISFVAGTGTFLNNSQVITNGQINITADLVALNADLVGTGQLTIKPFTESLAIGVGVAPTRVDFGGNNFITTAVASNSGRTLKIGGSSHTGGITVSGAYNPGSLRLELVTGGTMAVGAAGTVTAPDVVLAGSKFTNSAGAAAVVASNRWLVYSADPALNTFGGLTSGNYALWGRSYVANPPSTITATGNRYIFSKVPQMTATLAGGTVNKTYGTDLTGSVPSVSVSGLVDAAAFGNVFLQDSYGGTPTASSAGYAATAAVNNGVPYAVSISGLVAPDGYGTTITNDGQVIVSPFVVTLGGSRTYNGTLDFAASQITTGTLVGSEQLSLSGTGTVANPNVGTGKPLAPGTLILGDGANGGLAANYTLSGGSHAVNITPYVVSLNGTRSYNGSVDFAASHVSTGPLVGSEQLSLSGAGTVTDRNVGTGKPLAPGTLTLGDGANGGLAANYTLTGGTYTASITRALLDIKANDATKVFNALSWSGGNGATFSGFVAGETLADLGGTLAFAGTSEGVVNTGTYSLIPSGLTSSNYAINYQNGTLVVTPAPLGITANSAVSIYRGTGWTGGNGVTYTGLKGNDTVADLDGVLNFGGSSQGAVDVGSYSIIPFGQTSRNYSITYINGILAIAPASLGIIALSSSKTYGDTISFDGTEFRTSGLKNGETIGRVSLSSSGAHPLASVYGSPYQIIPYDAREGSFNPANYKISYLNGELSVVPAGLLAIAANSVVSVYDGVPWSGGAGVSYSGFRGVDTVADLSGSLIYGGTSQGAVDVGDYRIVPSGLSSPNYTISYIDGRLVIAPATLGIIANNQNKTFGTAISFTGTEFHSSGLLNDESIGSVALTSTGAAAGASVADGPYAIVPTNATGGTFKPSNYDISYIDGILEVDQAGLLGIAANSASKIYDGVPWSGGNGVIYSGFQGNDTPAMLSGTLSYSGTSQGATDVGNYSIIPSGQSSPNYTITYLGGNLAVNPAPLSIAAVNLSKNYGTSLIFTGTEFVSTGLQNSESIGSVSLTSAGALANAAVAQAPYPLAISNAVGGNFKPANYSISYVNANLDVRPVPLSVMADPKTKFVGTPDPALTFGVSGLVNDTQLGVFDTVASVLTGALTRNPGEAVADNPYEITRGSLAANSNYTLDYTPANLIITAADIVDPGPGPGVAPAQVIFAGLIHNVFYYRPGNFWHISLNASGADYGFDVMRGTGTEETRVGERLNRCDSVSGKGFCETWAFPQQQEGGK